MVAQGKNYFCVESIFGTKWEHVNCMFGTGRKQVRMIQGTGLDLIGSGFGAKAWSR